MNLNFLAVISAYDDVNIDRYETEISENNGRLDESHVQHKRWKREDDTAQGKCSILN